MSKLKIILFASLVILLALIVLAFLPRSASEQPYTKVAGDHIVQQGNNYLVQFDIINNEGRDLTYTVKISYDSYVYSEDVTISAGRSFGYSHLLDPQQLQSGVVNVTVYKALDLTPLANINYHLK